MSTTYRGLSRNKNLGKPAHRLNRQSTEDAVTCGIIIHIIRQDVDHNVRWNIAPGLPSADQVCPSPVACRHACQAADEAAALTHQCAIDAWPICSRCHQTELDSPAENLLGPRACVLHSIQNTVTASSLYSTHTV